MLLDDLAGGPGAERIALTRQVGAGDGLGNRSQCGRNDIDALQAAAPVGARSDRDGGGSARHPEYSQHVPNQVHDGDGGGDTPGIRLGDGLGDDALHVGHTKQGGRSRAAAIARQRTRRLSAPGCRTTSSAATAKQQREQDATALLTEAGHRAGAVASHNGFSAA